MTYDTSHAEVASSINGRGESISCSLQHVLSFVGLVPHNQSDDNDACHQIFLGSVSEWLRRWTRNPLGSTRAGSNPAAVVLFCTTKAFIISVQLLAITQHVKYNMKYTRCGLEQSLTYILKFVSTLRL